MDDEAAATNLRAFCALGGASIDWRTDLVRLLQSDIPLDRLLRDRLVALIDNVTGVGPRLELAGHKDERDKFSGIVARHDWMEIGRWAANYASSETKVKAPAEAAADYFGQGVKKVEAAITYYNKATLWADQAMKSAAGKAMGREWVERLYHTITVYPEMKALNRNLLLDLGLSH